MKTQLLIALLSITACACGAIASPRSSSSLDTTTFSSDTHWSALTSSGSESTRNCRRRLFGYELSSVHAKRVEVDGTLSDSSFETDEDREIVSEEPVSVVKALAPSVALWFTDTEAALGQGSCCMYTQGCDACNQREMLQNHEFPQVIDCILSDEYRADSEDGINRYVLYGEIKDEHGVVRRGSFNYGVDDKGCCVFRCFSMHEVKEPVCNSTDRGATGRVMKEIDLTRYHLSVSNGVLTIVDIQKNMAYTVYFIKQHTEL